MYIKVENKDKITRGEREQYSIDNYLTKDKIDNISVAVSHLRSRITPAFNIKNEKTE